MLSTTAQERSVRIMVALLSDQPNTREAAAEPDLMQLLAPLLEHLTQLCAAQLDREPRHCRLQLLLQLALRRLLLYAQLASAVRVHVIATRFAQAQVAINFSAQYIG